jgi:uncharacterized membrane protein YfcA
MSKTLANTGILRVPLAVFHRRRVKMWLVAFGLIIAALVFQVFRPSTLWTDSTAALGAAAILLLFLSAIICEYLDSALGMGYGTTLTPLLLIAGFEPLQIVPAVLFSEFITGMTAGLMHHHDGNIDFLRDRRAQGVTILLSLLSVIGATIAVTVAIAIPKLWLKLFISIMIVSIGAVTIATRRRRLRYRRGHIVVLGTIAAFNKGLSGGGYGPLVTAGQVVSGISPKHAVGITSVAEALTCLTGLVAYTLIHQAIFWWLAIPLTAGALFSVPMATLTVRRLPETAIRAGVGVFACVLGFITIIKIIW